jgi:hypothetical protein
MHALDEVKPAYGVSESEMKGCVMNGIIHFSSDINVISYLKIMLMYL